MLLWYVYITLLSLNVLFAIFQWRQLPGTLKVIFALVCWTLFIELCRNYSKGAEKNLLTHQNIVVEFTLIALYYFFLLQKKKRILIYGGVIFYFTAITINWLWVPTFFLETNFQDSVYLAICTSIWAILFFLELIRMPMHHSLKSDSNFWVNCSNILFYPGTLLLFGLGNYLDQVSPQLRKSLNPINYSLNLTLYGLYLIAFFCIPKEKKKAIIVK